jgi:hypothetical protein
MERRYMKAIYIGTDTSRGFEKGKEYTIRTKVMPIHKNLSLRSLFCLCIFDMNSKNWCPYSNLELVFDNWKITNTERSY